MDFLAAFDDESVTYTHDNAGQVTGAVRDGTGAVQDETYVMDSNGNRESVTRDGLATTTWSVGPNNQLLNDGKYAYTYDAEGNRLTRTVLVSGVATGEQYVYTWDYRNRLTEVRIKDAAADTTYDRGYKFIYDDQNRLAVKLGDLDGDGDYDEHGDIATFLWDGQNMTVLTPGGQIMSQIYGPQTDQLLFVRETNETFLPLADHLNTVRDVLAAKLDAGTYEAVHVEHNRYDSFGRVIQREQLVGGSLSVTTNPSYIRAGYTGKYFDITIGLQFNLNRWYDAEVGRWISEDPIGFAGGDVNLGRYVGNASVIYVDSNGLQAQQSIDINKFIQSEVGSHSKTIYYADTNIEVEFIIDANTKLQAPILAIDPKAKGLFTKPEHVGALVSAFDKNAANANPNATSENVWLSYKKRTEYKATLTNGQPGKDLAQLNTWEKDRPQIRASSNSHVDVPGADTSAFKYLQMKTIYAIVLACKSKANNDVLETPIASFSFTLAINYIINAAADPAANNVRIYPFASVNFSTSTGAGSIPPNWADLYGLTPVKKL